MGHRLSKITTRTGDKGETGLGNGMRVPKDNSRITALGEVDELNSSIGLLLTEPLPEKVREALVSVQHDLFDLGGEIAVPGHSRMTERQIERLEDELQRWNQDMPPLKEFILPGGTRPAALAHLTRTICRRAERALITLSNEETVGDSAKIYLNRLSDLLFVLGRVLNKSGDGDVLWQQGRNR